MRTLSTVVAFQNGPIPFGKFEFVVSWLYRELSALPVILRAVWNPTISWGVGNYRLKWGGEAEKLADQTRS